MQAVDVNTKTTKSNQAFLSRTYCIIGTLLADEGNLAEALEKFDLAIKADSNNQIALFNRATVKIDLGDIEGARNDFLTLDKQKNSSLTIRYEYQKNSDKTIYSRFV